jgi:hypothetical protein
MPTLAKSRSEAHHTNMARSETDAFATIDAIHSGPKLAIVSAHSA